MKLVSILFFAETFGDLSGWNRLGNFLKTHTRHREASRLYTNYSLKAEKKYRLKIHTKKQPKKDNSKTSVTRRKSFAALRRKNWYGYMHKQ